MAKYNGWKNYETWNVALWIRNDESLYSLAKECGSYLRFKEQIREGFDGYPLAYENPDGIPWNDSGLNIIELDDMIAEM